MARCPRCGGSGVDPEPAPECCGRLRPDHDTGEPVCCGNPDPVPQRCANCGGEGALPDDQLELG